MSLDEINVIKLFEDTKHVQKFRKKLKTHIHVWCTSLPLRIKQRGHFFEYPLWSMIDSFLLIVECHLRTHGIRIVSISVRKCFIRNEVIDLLSSGISCMEAIHYKIRVYICWLMTERITEARKYGHYKYGAWYCNK